MTPHQAIALGAALGLVLIVVVAYWRWSRRRSALRQRNTRMERAVRRVPPPLPPNLRVQSPDSTAEFVERMRFFAAESVKAPSAPPIELTPAERAEGWSVKTLGGMQVKVLPVPTSADPWDDDEPTTYRAPGGKR